MVYRSDNRTPEQMRPVKIIPDYITTQAELNALERENITEVTNWAEGRQHSDILNATFILDVHKRMLNRVWKWAGKQRTSNKNLGVFNENISNELANLLADVKYWIENKTYGWDEIGARFHHRLVSIHVFVNGNDTRPPANRVTFARACRLIH